MKKFITSEPGVAVLFVVEDSLFYFFNTPRNTCIRAV